MLEDRRDGHQRPSLAAWKMFCVFLINGICFALRIDCCCSNSADGGNSFNLTEVFGRFINFVP